MFSQVYYKDSDIRDSLAYYIKAKLFHLLKVNGYKRTQIRTDKMI